MATELGVFNLVRDSRGRTKIVLLLRPDVFHKLNLYNSNSRIQDNTVLLTWFTTDAEYLASSLYQVCGRFFAVQQAHNPTDDEAWRQYFPAANIFRDLLHLSFHRPRDILTFVKFFKSYQDNDSAATSFDSVLISSPRFMRDAADYLLGEVRNYSAFYMPPDDFGTYLKFFQYLDGKARLSMEGFVTAYKQFVNWARGEQVIAKEYLRDPEALLQLFYDVNVIGYREIAADASARFIHWSFRERTVNNIAPKVKNVGELLINPGVAKALDIGKQFTSRAETQQPEGRRRRPKRARGRRGNR